jgi:large subunit ribosomal protein L5
LAAGDAAPGDGRVFDRLIAIMLPRIRDFALARLRAIIRWGRHQTIFPEIELDKIKRQQGMDITIVTTRGRTRRLDLLKLMACPSPRKAEEAKRAKQPRLSLGAKQSN